jgi:hypothetical protein
VLAVTVHVVPLPLTPVIAGVPPSPELTSVKLLLFTPVTLVLNVTVQETADALLGVALAVLMKVTAGQAEVVKVRSLPLVVPSELEPFTRK